jgi:hypothetical protein
MREKRFILEIEICAKDEQKNISLQYYAGMVVNPANLINLSSG